MGPTNKNDLLTGGILQCVEAATLGMPFEVWKTYMGTYRDKSTIEAFKCVYRETGWKGFWRGMQPKMVESFLKGGILLYAKESLIRVFRGLGLDIGTSGLLGGFGGGVAQVTIMGPCTFLVTAAVTGDKSIGFGERIATTFKKQGIGGFYRGGTALIFRQGTNWASRQGFTDIIRSQFLKSHGPNGSKKLALWEEAVSGLIGGCLSTWNQPFEVLRIEAQAAATRGEKPRGFLESAKIIYRSNGIGGFYQGVIPRMGLCVWQTLFMVTVPHLMKAAKSN
eukprot:TRINITY_DN14473_c0_g1_i1.p1 TRINITY_DN14473_c0_g1~~TRINITY_DN14473_c0_g1_i1.p1  ORF type:complete len:279 (-),score=-20.59 TRINITY_DN14473_c0_g1_i1:26-862(-)